MTKSMTKPSGRKPMRVGAILLKEMPYKDEWRIDATWKDPGRGKSGRGHKTFHNWRHAEEFAAKENKKLELLKEKGAGRYTFNDAADSFLKRCEQRANARDRTLTADTLLLYRRDVEIVSRKFGHQQLQAIMSRDVEDWLIDAREKYSTHTTTRWMTRLNMVLDHAVDRDMLHTNPLRVKRIRLPGKYKKRVDIPDRSDLEALRKYLNAPRPLFNGRLKWSCLRVLVLLGASCGLRAGEVSGLRWDSIDPDTGEIEVKESIARFAGRKGTKTDAGYRKIPTTPRAREIINEHAVIYKQLEGKCVGSVLRTQDRDYLHPHMVSSWFREVMSECGLVKPGSKPDGNGQMQPKFTFHALRHWCASHWMKATGGDVHQVAKWMGHKNASMTLDIYGHCLDDPEARAKFERIPDWLNPAVELDAPPASRSALALSPPEEPPLEVNAEPIVEREFSIDVPDIAKPWVKPFLTMLFSQGILLRDAYRLIVPQLMPTGGTRRQPISAQDQVLAEFARLKLPTPKVLVARWRDERILQLHEQKYQMLDIARMIGCSKPTVQRTLESRHKPNASNLLKYKRKWLKAERVETPSAHKTQLKLL